MAKAKWLQDENKEIIIPKSLSSCIYDDDGKSLDKRLKTTDEDEVVNFPIADVSKNADDVGNIIAHMGVTPPKHYLACDGSTYNISDYPLLSEFIKTQLGSYNFFGGDGTTTFAVPDLRGEFLRGTGTNSHTNQGNGASVGVHQNATEQPNMTIWQGSSTNGDLIIWKKNENTSSTPNSVLNMDSSTKRTVDSRAVVGYYNAYYSDINSNPSFTSRPTNTSVLWCIKYESNEYIINPKHNYLTEEKVIGTWINGKPLYEKTVHISSLPNKTTVKYPHGIENMDECTNYFGTIKWSSTSYSHLDLSHPDNPNSFINTSILNSSIDIETKADRSSLSANITIQYTKTTDN